MSILNWSNYRGRINEIQWSKDDLLEYLDVTENVSETSSGGLSFMHVACAKGWQDVVEKLNQVDPSMKDGQDDLGKFFIMWAEFDKNISDWSHDCTDLKNGIDFFLRLIKWPKIAVKKKQTF